MMTCAPLSMRLSTSGCARMHLAAQDKEVTPWDAKSACKFCPVGAGHAGVTVAPMAKARSDLRMVCPRCERNATRLIHGRHCISCYNRDREARLGVNSKGTRPALADHLHIVALAVGEGHQVAVRQSGTVASRVEAIVLLAKSAQATMAFGAAGLEWAA